MGGDKAIVAVGGVPMLQRVAAALATHCSELILVGGDAPVPPGARRARGERPGGHGPLAGMEAGVAAARYETVFVAAVDMPFLPAELVRGLAARVEQSSGCVAAVPRRGGRAHPLCAAYDRRVLGDVRERLDEGRRAVGDLLNALGDTVAYVDDEELRAFGDPDVFLMNVNSPRDLALAESVAATC